MTDDLVKRLRDLADCAVDVAPYETMLQAAHRIEILGMRIREFEQTLDTLQSDVRDAVKMWRYANPGNDVKWPDHANLCGWLMDKAKQDADRIEQLEEALLVFAKRSEWYDEDDPDNLSDWDREAKPRITIKDLRRARAALETSQ